MRDLTKNTEGKKPPQMFDYSKPIVPQILEWMKELDYSEKNIEYARKKMVDEKDLKYAENMVKNLGMMLIGKSILKGIEEGKIDIKDLLLGEP